MTLREMVAAQRRVHVGSLLTRETAADAPPYRWHLDVKHLYTRRPLPARVQTQKASIDGNPRAGSGERRDIIGPDSDTVCRSGMAATTIPLCRKHVKMTCYLTRPDDVFHVTL